jgi:hypothetical protein
MWQRAIGEEIVRTDRTARSGDMEATDNGKTRGRRVDAGARRGCERERSERGFRDIHGTEYFRHPNTVLVDSHHRRDTTGDDDVLRRHWIVVCADRGGSA